MVVAFGDFCNQLRHRHFDVELDNVSERIKLHVPTHVINEMKIATRVLAGKYCLHEGVVGAHHLYYQEIHTK